MEGDEAILTEGPDSRVGIGGRGRLTRWSVWNCAGRLALVAFLGFAIQAIAYPGTGPLENLKTHLADPWHNTIANILIPRSVL